MLSKQIKSALCSLGTYLQREDPDLKRAMQEAEAANRWFTQEQQAHALRNWSGLLTEANLEAWLAPYASQLPAPVPKKVGIIMAGNIPLVGFHDLLCVLVSGHKALVKPSSDDTVLMKHVIRFLQTAEPSLQDSIIPVEKLEGFDGVIATGSNNTNRYFRQYFGQVPHLLRRNRTSIAVLTGEETPEQLRLLGEDIFRYFGLGCRNVTKLYVPQGYDLKDFFEGIFSYSRVIDHPKYANNHDYYRAIYLLNQEPFLDNNFLLVKEESHLHSPVSVLYYERYDSWSALQHQLASLTEELQCIVSESGKLPGEIPFGNSQRPGLSDYADGVDTLAFLAEVK